MSGFVSYLLLCLSLTATAAANGPDLIEKACGASKTKDLCTNFLKSNPKSEHEDLKGLAFIVLEAAVKTASEAATQIKVWMRDNDVEPAVDEGLRTCEQEYVDVVDQIEDSMTALVSNSFVEVEAWVKAAMADMETCMDSVDGKDGNAIEITRKTSGLRQLCTTALSVVLALMSSDSETYAQPL